MELKTIFSRPLMKLGLVSLIIILCITFVYQLYLLTQFHIVNTNPGTGSVSALSPYMQINFNRPLSTNNLSVERDPSFISSYKVQNKTLIINFVAPLSTNQTYSIKILTIADSSGHQLHNRIFTFIAKDIAFQNLPSDQQKTVLKNQTAYKNSTNNTSFINTDSLVSAGISSQQITVLDQQFSEYSPSAKTITINPNSIATAPHDPRTDSSFMMNFSVSIDSKSYNATISYSDLNTVHLILHKATDGAQVFDSDNPTAPSGN